MTATKSREVWSDFYEDAESAREGVPESFVARAFTAQKPVPFLRDYAFEGKEVLDVGCGNGRHSRFLSSLGFRVSACDVAGPHVRRLQERIPTVSFFAGALEHVPVNSQQFDYVLGANSIYYLENDHSSIEKNVIELCRVLKPGGCLVASFVAEGHFILEGGSRVPDGSLIIRNDPLGFRNGARIRPVWDDEPISSLVSPLLFALHKKASIRDACDGFCRALNYYSFYKR